MNDPAGLWPTLVGLDLAWSERHPSGLALAGLRGGRLRVSELQYLTTDREITEWIDSRAKTVSGPFLLGVDAPLIAPNPGGTAREADRALSRGFGRYHAGVYPANRERCARPIRLRRQLERLGFSPDPLIRREAKARHQLELYPHSSLVALLSLSRIIKYKKGTVAARRRGLCALQDAIGRLAGLDPVLAPSGALHELVLADPFRLRGRSLKRLEDLLDSVILAYVAGYYWRWGLERCQMVGDLRGGYILTVVLPPAGDVDSVGRARPHQ